MKTKAYKTIVRIVVGVTIGIIVLFVWDLLTSDPYESLTINPCKIDWANFSIDNVNINALIQSLLSALISIVLTIVLIELILRESREKEIEYSIKDTTIVFKSFFEDFQPSLLYLKSFNKEDCVLLTKKQYKQIVNFLNEKQHSNYINTSH